MTAIAGAASQSPVTSETRPGSLVLPWIFAAAEAWRTHRKLLGERAECAFLAAAMERGLIVSKPYGDSAPYDFVVERRRSSVVGRRRKAKTHRRGGLSTGLRAGSGRRGSRQKAGANHEGHPSTALRAGSGKLWKVQVKSVQGKDPQGRYSVNMRKSFSRRYEPGELDFFAVWIAGAGTWYIVPGSEVFPAKGGHFYPDVRGSRGKYERYREAWGLLSG